MAKNKYPTGSTPKGVAMYPTLSRPDTKYNKAGEFHIRVVIPREGNEDYFAKLDALSQEVFDQTKVELKEKKKIKNLKALKLHVPYNEEYDSDTEEETGNLIVGSIKCTHNVTPKNGKSFQQTPKLFDSKGKKLNAHVRIGGGSTVRVAYTVIPFYNASTDSAGISLRLTAVKVLELVEWGDAGAESFGFGEEEEGFDFNEEDHEASDFSEDTEDENTGEGDNDQEGDDDEF
jgi:Single-stranded DNA-binding protein, Bacteriophage T7